MTDLKQKILNAVAKDLAAIEQALEENLNPYFDLVEKIAGHILFSGGKRLRPLLMVLCARVCGYDGSKAAKFSTIFEYLHAATLLHDDLVDEAELRRGKTVANHVWDNPTAVLTGDFLLARGLSIASETKLCDVIAVIARITEDMSQGEIRQLEKKGDIHLSEPEYMEVIERKTAVLFRGACRTGALISTAGDAKTESMTQYGYHLGMAFQMADDLLDYTLDTKALGKKVGADLREGKLTLPVIHALSRANGNDKETMVRIITDDDFSIADFTLLIDLLHQYGGVAYTKQKAVHHIQAAQKALSMFPASDAKQVLMDIADYALVRKV